MWYCSGAPEGYLNKGYFDDFALPHRIVFKKVCNTRETAPVFSEVCCLHRIFLNTCAAVLLLYFPTLPVYNLFVLSMTCIGQQACLVRKTDKWFQD